MIENPDIPNKLHEHYHRVENDEIVKSIFNYGKNKERLGNGNYRVDDNGVDEASTIVCFNISDPDTPITTAAEIIIASLDEATQISITTARSLEDLDAQQNVKIVKEHLADEEIEKIMKEPRSHKERVEVEKSTNLITINDEEEEELDEDALRRKKGKGVHKTLKESSPKLVDNNTNEFMSSTLRGQGILVIKVRTGGGDVVRLGAELERLWCKVEVCGGVCGGDLAAATLRLQGRDVASFRAKR
ncbi:hypothetical protein Tco_1046176 [Tanacetum coccineum]